MSESSTPRILSIQSHVVSGYVGNKSATFPLQLLGFEVDAINSVQLSNHTGYKAIKGQVLNSQDLMDLMDGITQNNLDNYTHLLTGYVGSASFLRQIAQVVQNLKKKNPKLLYVCDPVMGDNGKMYVPEELKEIYQKEIIPLADIITPNHFELELLLNKKMNTLADIKDNIQVLHKLGIKIIAISSINIEEKLISIVSSNDDEMIKIEIPQISAIYTGSGDLYAALFLAHTYLQKNLKLALENTINSLHDVLLKTFEYAQGFQDKNVQNARKYEIRLIQSKEFISHPSNKLQAQIV